MAERRKHVRHRRRLQVKFGEEDLAGSGFTTDVSFSGLFVSTNRLLNLDTRFHLQLHHEPSRFIFLEAVVRRHKVVPPKLRQIERGGFGAQFLLPSDLLAGTLSAMEGGYELHFQSRDELRRAFDAELRLGGVFIPTHQLVPANTEISLELYLDFANHKLDALAKVVHVSSAGVQGLGLALEHPKRVQAALKPYLADPEPA